MLRLFAPDEGERLGEVTPTSKDNVLNSALVPRRYPTGSGVQTRVKIDPAQPVHHCSQLQLPLVHPALTHTEGEPFKRSRMLVGFGGRGDKRGIGHKCDVEV